MSDIKEMLESWANRPFIEHADYSKCGQCWREKIRSQVANEFLQAGKLSAENLNEMLAETDKRWRETELYMRVQALRKAGKTLEEIEEELLKEGVDI